MAKKILLVEDDPFLSEIYITKFEEAGYVVEVADDGEKGFQKIKTSNPDIVLLDIILPKMTGLEILESAKRDNALKDIPVIILSNLGSDDDTNKALELGAKGYLIKSQYTPSEVVAKVEEILNK
ncbi:MAG: response regulator transcription factor [Candidatus Spechtbacteria bacterium]|nr:response regulator transcription factor [Candidatus Spechtbacteria bacterium]